MLSLELFINVGSPADGIIYPWNSAFFDFYPLESDDMEDIVPMRERDIYTNDRIGLKQLDEEGKLI